MSLCFKRLIIYCEEFCSGGDEMEKNEISEACSTYEGQERFMQGL